MKSSYLFIIEKTENIQNKEVNIKEYITDYYVYVERSDEKKFLYIKNQNSFFSVDFEYEKLKKNLKRRY